MLKPVCFIRCVDAVENAFKAYVKKSIFWLDNYYVLNAMYCNLGSRRPGSRGPQTPSAQSGIRGKRMHDFFLELQCHAARNNSIYLSHFCLNRQAPLRKPYFYVNVFQ